MDILILGGTGAMGSHVSGLLKAKGYNIFITSRSERKNGNGITYLQGNAKELAFITGLCQRRWDAIIDFMVYSLDELKERINMILESTNQYILLVLQEYMQILR